MGQVQGDLSSRRGVLLGSETIENYAVIRAEVPFVEMFGYSAQLRSLSSGQANFSMEFASNKPVPANLQQQLMENAAHLRG
ncbi:hypothetical protein H6F61_23895 [Cyanobacteria bacterium FACHB-472]|nr:hypothetical protein [Cyanobacteria bacterium FACHB-472]